MIFDRVLKVPMSLVRDLCKEDRDWWSRSENKEGRARRV